MRVGDNAEMMALGDYSLHDCPYSLTIALERFKVGHEFKYATLVHYRDDGVFPTLSAWFQHYNQWQTIDLSMWCFNEQWFWMIDILDAYSRYLVHCELLLTAKTDAVERAVQRALDTLAGRPLLAGEPQIVHDGGPQFVGHDWVQFMHAVGTTDVRTHPYHPQSNGLDERVHRTFREELPIESEVVLYEARTMMLDYCEYYNHRRPHSALQYLCPVDYYRSDPAARLAEREAKLRAAAAARVAYWQQERDPAAQSLS